MAEKIETGGTAFPMQDPQAIHAYAVARIAHINSELTEERDQAYIAARSEAVGGITLRDYFAAHEQLDPNQSIGKALAEKLTGRRLPDPDDGGFADQHELALATAIFWADAEAAYRYLRADAMIRARSAK